MARLCEGQKSRSFSKNSGFSVSRSNNCRRSTTKLKGTTLLAFHLNWLPRTRIPLFLTIIKPFVDVRTGSPPYIPPPVSISAGGRRHGTLTAWARQGDYRHMPKKWFPPTTCRGALCLAICLHSSARIVPASCSLRAVRTSWCTEKNHRKTPPSQPPPPPAPPGTPKDGSGEKEAPGRPVDT